MTERAQVKIFVTDCEGPISKNDNAYELASHYIPGGSRFYALISRYDDVLAEVLRREDYKAGDTLKLILPFLKAYGVTDQNMIDFSARDIRLVRDAKDTMRFVQKTMPAYIVSTSYEHYISALCKAISFPEKNTYSTKVNLDKYLIESSEKEVLKQLLTKEIAKMPMIQIPKNAATLADFSSQDQATLKRLDEIFWKQIPKMVIGRIYHEVNPVGGREKAVAVREIIAKCDCDVDCVLYVGDSITDVECFRLVRDGGGVAVSFNGNEYAVRAVQVAVMSESTVATSILADVFCRGGKDAVLRLAEEWASTDLERFEISSALLERAKQLRSQGFPKMSLITSSNREKITKDSVAFRKTVRGEAIAGLG